jgi:hypothetical protein
MKFASSRATLAMFVLVGLLEGCASGQGQPTNGAAPQVTSADLRDPQEPIEVVLQRKVPGLVVTRTGDGGIALQIRGASSYNGSDTPPLFVLNGLHFQPGARGALTGVNPTAANLVQAILYALATRLGAPGRNRWLLVMALLIGVTGGWVTAVTGGIAAAFLGHAVTRFAVFLSTGHAGQFLPRGREVEEIEARRRPPQGWRVIGSRETASRDH